MFKGVDFYLITLNSEVFPLQVKSSWTGLRKHLRKFPNIPVMIVESGDCIENVKKKIKNLLIRS
jgi:hypothetical protein